MKKNNNGIILVLVISLILMVLSILSFNKTGLFNKKPLSTDNNSTSNSIIQDNSDNNNVSDNSSDIDNLDCEKNYSAMLNDNYIYKATVTNKDGASVYDTYTISNQKVVDKLESGKVIGVVGDIIDYFGYGKESYSNISEIKDYYYIAILVCGDPRYVKYSDVSIDSSSVVMSNKYDKINKVYIREDEDIYSGPGLSFDIKGKISKGTLVDVNIYNRIGNAIWLYVDKDNYQGWILKDYYNSVNYPYNNLKYGYATLLNTDGGTKELDSETSLYKYTDSSEELIIIPSGTIVSYDYSIGEPGVDYYHVLYNNTSGWIMIS